MGNCFFRAPFESQEEEMITVVTSTGAIMKLNAPITAGCITDVFPGHAVYLSNNTPFSLPLLQGDSLRAGHLYFVRPLGTIETQQITPMDSPLSSIKMTPCRVSHGNIFHKRVMVKRADIHLMPMYGGGSGGEWKVKLVIRKEELEDILAQETRTKTLIENVSAVAKCGASKLANRMSIMND